MEEAKIVRSAVQPTCFAHRILSIRRDTPCRRKTLRLCTGTEMATYLINHLRIPGDMPNSDALEYLDKVEETVSPFGGKWLAQGPVDVLEGGWPGAVVLMAFPSRDAAMAWYRSPAYQAILPLRVKSAISDLVLIDALPDEFTLKGFVAQLRAAASKAV
jgi:uncharacterized protein (DUF1330 family)